jgi:hypothetical protein
MLKKEHHSQTMKAFNPFIEKGQELNSLANLDVKPEQNDIPVENYIFLAFLA